MDEAAGPAHEGQLPPPPPPPPLLPLLPPPLSLQKALQQCELVQNMIDISISNLEGLRTKCATSNDLTQKEIRTLEASLLLLLPFKPLMDANGSRQAGCSLLAEELAGDLKKRGVAARRSCGTLLHSAYKPEI
uniref:Uncharacterized protein n=1 Tax=Sphaerodactylus townsendi TaxID=933632 RepID=A0ACB8FYA6_9SAUR